MKLILVHIPKTAGTAIFHTYKDEIYKYWGHNTRQEKYQTFPEYLKKHKNNTSISEKVNRILGKKSYFSFAVLKKKVGLFVSVFQK